MVSEELRVPAETDSVRVWRRKSSVNPGAPKRQVRSDIDNEVVEKDGAQWQHIGDEGAAAPPAPPRWTIDVARRM